MSEAGANYASKSGRLEARVELPGSWRATIVDRVEAVIGECDIVLIGSRARGEARWGSDCDIAVVVSARRVSAAARVLPAVGRALEAELGVGVSVNPVPALLLKHIERSLYLAKIRTEGVRLNWCHDARRGVCQHIARSYSRDPGLPAQIPWDPKPISAKRAVASYLYSAVHNLISGIDPRRASRTELDMAAESAVVKAAGQYAQALILRRGQYVPSARSAISQATQLGILPAVLSGMSAFSCLRQRLCEALVTSRLDRHYISALGRDIQYVALSRLRGRSRLRLVARSHNVEESLGAASVLLLRSLSLDLPGGCDMELVHRAALELPSSIRPAQVTYEEVRSSILLEWISAHPLVGVIP